MTAPDPDYVLARLHQAAAMLERRAFLDAEIAAGIDSAMATQWPDVISRVAADMQTLAEQAAG